MRLMEIKLILVTLMLGVTVVDKAWARRSCTISPKLRDKWLFSGKRNATFMRIRPHTLIYVDKNSHIKIRYKCQERRGNIYLLRTHRTPHLKNGLLCLGFSYLGRSTFVEYGMLRLNSNGDRFSLISPKPTRNIKTATIKKSCDLLYGSHREAFDYIRRAGKGCRFPKHLRGDWSNTYMRAMKITFTRRSMMYLLTDNTSLILNCDKRDGKIFLLRTKNYNNTTSDAIVCFKITNADDSYYKYELSPMNSGTKLEDRFKLIPAGKEAHIHQDCDWIDSPGRPEYLYH